MADKLTLNVKTDELNSALCGDITTSTTVNPGSSIAKNKGKTAIQPKGEESSPEYNSDQSHKFSDDEGECSNLKKRE